MRETFEPGTDELLADVSPRMQNRASVKRRRGKARNVERDSVRMLKDRSREGRDPTPERSRQPRSTVPSSSLQLVSPALSDSQPRLDSPYLHESHANGYSARTRRSAQHPRRQLVHQTFPSQTPSQVPIFPHTLDRWQYPEEAQGIEVSIHSRDGVNRGALSPRQSMLTIQGHA